MKPLFASARRQRAARRLGWLLALLVILADRLSKLWVMDGLGLAPGESMAVLPVFSLTFVWNEGVSLGLFKQGTDIGRWVLIGLTAGISLLLAFWLQQTRERLAAMAIGAILGGAIGNIWDRVHYGAVADFLHLHVGGWSFYIFNIADAAISIGVVLLLVESFRRPE